MIEIDDAGHLDRGDRRLQLDQQPQERAHAVQRCDRNRGEPPRDRAQPVHAAGDEQRRVRRGRVEYSSGETVAIPRDVERQLVIDEGSHRQDGGRSGGETFGHSAKHTPPIRGGHHRIHHGTEDRARRHDRETGDECVQG